MYQTLCGLWLNANDYILPEVARYNVKIPKTAHNRKYVFDIFKTFPWIQGLSILK